MRESECYRPAVLLNALVAIAVGLLLSVAGVAQAPRSNARLPTELLKQPMSFEPNVGQWPQMQPGRQSLFASRGAGYSLQLGAAQARLELDAASVQAEQKEIGASGRITLTYLGANASVAVTGQTMLPGKHHYIPTGDAETWHSNVPTYGAVEYRHLYPGIDLSFYGNSDRLEYDFTVAPAADAAQMRLAVGGTQSVSVDSDGNLVLVSNRRTVRFLKPVAYQKSASGERVPVDATYRLERRGKAEPVIAFNLGSYDHAKELVVDPVVDYAFYVPATVNGYMYVGTSTTDAAGNTYIAGTFPLVSRRYNSYQYGFFVAKYNAAWTQVFYTPLGTKAFSGSINSIAVDSAGKVYVAGEVAGNSGGLPAVNSFQSTPGSPYSNGFMAVLSADGSALTYSTYFGANASVSSIAIDASGNAAIAGIITYNTFTSLPIRPNPGAPVPTEPNLGPSAPSGFVAKFNPSVSGDPSLIYSTFLGTTGIRIGSVALAVDTAGDAYVTGNGLGVTYPTTPGAYTYNGRDPNNDVFVTKVNAAGTAFVYSALLGPGVGQAIAVDSSKNVYVTGTVYEDDYPTTSGAYQTSYPSGFVTELNSSGSALVYSTFLGGANDHLAPGGVNYTAGSSYIYPTHLALPPGCSSACSVYVAGVTTGNDLPLVDPVQSYVPGSAFSGFYMQLAGDGSSLLQSSYIASGSGFDPYQQVPSIGVDSSANIYIAGDVLPALFPVTKPVTGRTGEAFLARIIPASGAKLAVTPPSITFAAQVEGVTTAQQGLSNPTVTLENLGSTPVTLSSIKVSNSVFSQTNNCGGAVPAAGSCTLTLSYKPTAAATQTGTITFASNASLNPTLQLSGTGKSDSFLLATCGGTSECAGLTYPDKVVGSASPGQVLTVTNLGNVSTALTSIVSSLPDYSILTNCPLTGSGLAQSKTCQISIAFHPTQVGLRAGTITIKWPGTTANTLTIPVAGTGLLSPNPSSLVLLGSMLNFGTVRVGATSATQTLSVFNNGTAPATVFAPTVTTTGDASGVNDYVITANNCLSVLPAGTPCSITVAFVPTATGTRSGTITIPTSASSTPLTSSLTGIGVATKQTLEFTPDKVTFPDQVVDTSSAAISASVYNAGTAPVYIDRVLVSGSYQLASDNCSQTSLAIPTLAGQYSSCLIGIVFSPTSAGMKTGTVTVIDSEGNQMPLSLAGNAVAQNGALLIYPAGLDYGTLPVGSTGNPQLFPNFSISNIGNSPVTVTGATITGDYSFTPSPAFPWVLQGGANCCYSLSTRFTPTKVANPDNGTIKLATSAGTQTINLTGVGEAATKAVLLTPPSTASLNFGSIQVGKSSYNGYGYEVFLLSQGTDPVTLSSGPTITGPNASDFSIQLTYCGNAAVFNPGNSCYTTVNFTPSAPGTRNATLTFTDDASTGGGTQSVPLVGVGTTAVPAYTLIPATISFGPQVVSTPYKSSNVTFVNNGASTVTFSSITYQPAGVFTGSTPVPSDCAHAPVPAGQSCNFGIYFTPTAAGAVHGTATLTDTGGKTYVIQLYGYAEPIAYEIVVNPSALSFAPQPQLSSSALSTVYLGSNSDYAFTVGQLTSSNPAYSISSDGCSGRSISAGTTLSNACSFQVALAPTSSTAVGSQTGTITIPVTYFDKTTVNFTLKLSGKVVAPYNSAEITPVVFSFYDQPVNSGSNYQGYQRITLTNKSNEAFTVGTLTSTNTSSSGPFVLTSGTCGGALNVGASCYEQIEFAPTTAATGVKGTLTFPITFTNGKTTSLTATYSGNALAAKSSLVVTPSSGSFEPVVVGQTSYPSIAFSVTNNGNQPVSFGTATLTSTPAAANFTRSNFDYNSCSGNSLAAGASCTFNIFFTPQSAGAINGLLTIADGSATGGPHKIPLVGTGLAASNTIGVSQSAVNFGDVTVGSSGSQAAVYLTNQSASPVSGFTYTLGGTNAADFTLQTNTCGATLLSASYGGNRQICALLVSFNPAKASLNKRNASVTIAFGGSTGGSIGSPITVNLQGTGVPPAPDVALFPSSLSYPTQAVGSKSALQYFRLYNTGSASLSVTAFGSTNAAEFSIGSNTCSGKTLTVAAGQSCLIGVAFSPSAAGTRTGAIQFTDNAKNVAGSTQTVALSGAGVAVPLVTLSPASVAFGNQNVGTSSATQTVTVANPGAAALTIGSIVLGGTNAGDFALTAKTCGTTLASKASCTLTVQFAPMVAGSRKASILLTDNADTAAGVSQPTQTISLGGTGVGVPAASVTPSSVGFGSGKVGTPTAAMTVTLKNSGTGALAIASITVSGTNAADFTYASGCGTSLAAGAQCTVSVTFTAKATGARSGSLVITDNSGLAAGSTQAVSLSGTGT